MDPLLRLANGQILIPQFWIFWNLALCAGLIFYFQRIRKLRLDFKVSWNLAWVILVGGILGARALHVLYEEPVYYFNSPSQILSIWNGGLVFYGGLLGAALTGLSYLAYKKLPWKIWLDALIPALSLGYIIGRLGCFVNGCCYGRFCSLPWAVNGRHPTQLYAVLAESILLASLLFWEKNSKVRFPGRLLSIWLITHSLTRITIEQWRDDPRGQFFLDLSISSWMSLFLFFWGIILLALTFKKK